MDLYYTKDSYIADNSIAIMAWTYGEYGYEPYGDVTICLAGYGMTPDKGHIYMPTYKMSPEFIAQVLKDISEEIVGFVSIGYADGLYVQLKDDWEDNVKMLDI